MQHTTLSQPLTSQYQIALSHIVIIIPIPKLNKKKCYIIKYKPIPPINILAKTTEKMVNNRFL